MTATEPCPPITPPRRGEVVTESLRFGTLEWGPTDGPLALCLHGYPDTAWTWRYIGPQLAELGWRVVAPFSRGYAPTDLAPDGAYQLGALATDAIELRRALAGEDDAVLIGHDWGAIAASVAGAHEPGAFAKIVTLAVPPLAAIEATVRARPLHEVIGLGARQLAHSWYITYQQIPMLSERSLRSVVPFLWKTWSPNYDATEDVALVFEALDDPARRTAALRYYRSLVQPWHRRAHHAATQASARKPPQVPLLHIHGRDDGCLLPELADHASQVLADGSRVELVDGAGHFLTVEAPDVVSAMIADFIA